AVREHHAIARESRVPRHVLRHEDVRKDIVIGERDQVGNLPELRELARGLEAARVLLLARNPGASREAVQRRADRPGEAPRVVRDQGPTRRFAVSRGARHTGAQRGGECRAKSGSHSEFESSAIPWIAPHRTGSVEVRKSSSVLRVLSTPATFLTSTPLRLVPCPNPLSSFRASSSDSPTTSPFAI